MQLQFTLNMPQHFRAAPHKSWPFENAHCCCALLLVVWVTTLPWWLPPPMGCPTLHPNPVLPLLVDAHMHQWLLLVAFLVTGSCIENRKAWDGIWTGTRGRVTLRGSRQFGNSFKSPRSRTAPELGVSKSYSRTSNKFHNRDVLRFIWTQLPLPDGGWKGFKFFTNGTYEHDWLRHLLANIRMRVQVLTLLALLASQCCTKLEAPMAHRYREENSLRSPLQRARVPNHARMGKCISFETFYALYIILIPRYNMQADR